MTFLGLTQAQWQEVGISLAIFVAALILGRWLIRGLLIPVLRRIFRRTETKLDASLLKAVGGPLYWLLLIFTAQFALNRLDFVRTRLEVEVADIYFVLYVIVFFLLAWRAIGNLSNWYTAEFSQQTDAELGHQLMPFVSRVAYALLFIIAGIIVLGHFNIEVSGLVATLGIGSLAIALAAQATLADTIAGFVIMIDRPYRIGDRIEILELDTWGDVLDIGLRSTRIRTRDNRMAIIPNSLIGKNLVVNHSYPDDNYRLQIHVGIDYGTDIEEARRVLIEAVRKVDGVLADKPVEALFLEFGDSALIFRVRWWLDSYVDTRRMFDAVNTSMYTALNEAGIEMPRPQRDVHHKIDTRDQAAFGKLLKK